MGIRTDRAWKGGDGAGHGVTRTMLVNFKPPQVISATAMGMVAEQRVWLCVLLRGIAETDIQNVTGIGGPAGKRERKREALRANAVAWMASDDFEVVCQNAGVDVKYARLLSPERAEKAYQALVTGKVAELMGEVAGVDMDEMDDTVMGPEFNATTGDDSAD